MSHIRHPGVRSGRLEWNNDFFFFFFYPPPTSASLKGGEPPPPPLSVSLAVVPRLTLAQTPAQIRDYNALPSAGFSHLQDGGQPAEGRNKNAFNVTPPPTTTTPKQTPHGGEEDTERKVSMKTTFRCLGCNLTAPQWCSLSFPPLLEATMTPATFDRYSCFFLGGGGIIKSTVKPQERQIVQQFVSSAVCGLLWSFCSAFQMFWPSDIHMNACFFFSCFCFFFFCIPGVSVFTYWLFSLS